ncbi:MAG: alpha/beta fold hydrolase [Chitinophagales bacterium]|nr:alpha/beta fold hydrolase [Chitinophagales bacterium]
MPQEQTITVRCADQTPLCATLFLPDQTPTKAVMIAPATGIRRKFYAAFARHLSEQGWGVITFDNRGIGDSLQDSVRNSDASLQVWGEQDMPAILEELKRRFPNANYHLVGHSAGGQLVGLMHNQHDLQSILNFACSSGSLQNMKGTFWWRAQFFMNVFIPLNNRLFGYTNTQWIGMGEPLPKQVAKEWRTWCNGRGYVKMAFGKSIQQHWYDDVRCPALWLYAPDDHIANEANVRDMMSVFPSMRSDIQELRPADYSLSHIGHMQFFSGKANVLWKIAVEWLDGTAANKA